MFEIIVKNILSQSQY